MHLLLSIRDALHHGLKLSRGDAFRGFVMLYYFGDAMDLVFVVSHVFVYGCDHQVSWLLLHYYEI